jgi:hypothetical protein
MIKGSGRFSGHAREGGHPVHSVPNFLDSCLRRNDGLYRHKLTGSPNNSVETNTFNELNDPNLSNEIHVVAVKRISAGPSKRPNRGHV